MIDILRQHIDSKTEENTMHFLHTFQLSVQIDTRCVDNLGVFLKGPMEQIDAM